MLAHWFVIHPGARFVPLAQGASIFSPSWDCRPVLLAHLCPVSPCAYSFMCLVPRPGFLPQQSASHPVARARMTVSCRLHRLLLFVPLLFRSSRFVFVVFFFFWLFFPLVPTPLAVPAQAPLFCPLLCRVLWFFFGVSSVVFLTFLPACTGNTAALVLCCCGSSLVWSLVLSPPWGFLIGSPRPYQVGAPPLRHPLAAPHPAPPPVARLSPFPPLLLLAGPACVALLLSAPGLYRAGVLAYWSAGVSPDGKMEGG